MKVTAIIPVRLSSTRLPNKPLAIINNKTMIEIVYKNVLKSKVDDVFVACDDQSIFDTVINFGGKAIMTSKNHENGTSRLYEATKNLETDYVLNVQGDEPLITYKSINKLIENISSRNVVYSLYTKIDDNKVDDPNTVKVIIDKNSHAIYFSRSKIPFERNQYSNFKKHIGIYLYKKSFLNKFINLPKSSLEIAESLEQLRILENSFKIKLIYTQEKLVGVDTLEDLNLVRSILSEK
jgi:3-deoxy-manno-octulosonate cytidylyltransferase (CMP-KDO synthetase)